MGSYDAELRGSWDRIDCHDGGALQIPLPHPLEWHVRYAGENQKSLVAVSDIAAGELPSSRAIEAACRQRRDGRYALSFTLLNRAEEDVFITMAGDMIAFSSDAASPADAVQRVLRRYAAWVRLFERRQSELLGIHAQKGLLGELLFLKEVIEGGHPMLEAVAGWAGPDGADQDFFYDDGWHEVKAVGAAAQGVSISSVEQLDHPMAGELVVFRIDACVPQHNNAATLYQTVSALEKMAVSIPGAAETLFLKLAAAGYVHREEYDQQHFFVSAQQRYAVTENFPRMRRAGLPREVVNISYQLDLPSLAPWEK